MGMTSQDRGHWWGDVIGQKAPIGMRSWVCMAHLQSFSKPLRLDRAPVLLEHLRIMETLTQVGMCPSRSVSLSWYELIIQKYVHS